jgi:NADPH:quinone reductase-like Zn-dependent oxidoreductase
MRAAVLTELGATPEVAEFDEPVAGEGQDVVDVLAAGLNPIDLRTTSGVLKDRTPPVPSVVGSEGIGRTADGRRVYFARSVPPFGSIAERSLVDSASLVEVPDGVEDAQAVAFGIAGTAAWGALSRRGQLQPGERVLILGASGVVGLIAVQAAKLMGAGHVTAAARSEAGLARARELGADATVRLGDDVDFPEVDLVIDPLWGAPAAAAVDALAPRGRLVHLGQTAGAEATLGSVNLRFKELSILGYTNFMSTPEEQAAALTAMWRHAAAGELVADVESAPLADVARMWERQASSPRVKLVLVP